jgi:hypothetical protein
MSPVGNNLRIPLCFPSIYHMLRPYSYSFSSFPKNASSPSNSSSRGTPHHQPQQHPHHPPPIEELDPSPDRVHEMMQAFSRFNEVEFDCGHFDWSKNHTFKYVLIELSSTTLKDSRLLVRGMTSAEFHADSAEPTLRQIDVVGLSHRVIGGGRIKYTAAKKSLIVYGHSIGYPWPDGHFQNQLAASMIKRNFPNLTVDWSDEGY